MIRILLIASLCFSLSVNKAQFVYSTVWSDFSPTYTLTSGISTTNTPGFLWAGYQPLLWPGGYPWSMNNLNICVRGYGLSSFWTGYKLYDGNSNNCTGSTTQIMDGRGVTIREVAYKGAIGQLRNVLVGSYNNGCYFFGTALAGNPIVSMLYPFPSNLTSSGPPPSRPRIVQDNLSTDFYITGSVGGKIYVMRINASGSVIWSNVFSMSGNATPNDIMICSVSPARLLVVGSVEQGSNDTDGFIMDMDPNNGICNNTKVYGNPGKLDEFRSVIAATGSGANNGPGYIVSGMTEGFGSAKKCWITKLDLAGNIVWARHLNPSSGNHNGIIDVIERQNTNFGFEYYALVNSAAGMVVLKLDDQGLPFPLSNTVLNNEFVYNLPGTSNSLPASIAMVNNVTNGPNLGLQIFGTASNITTANTSHMVHAYFNGETNCYRTLQQQSAPQNAIFGVNNFPVNAQAGLTACSNFTVQVLWVGGAINFPCSGYNLSGDNARTINVTGIQETEKANASVKLFPNPAKDRTTVQYYMEENDEVNIEVSDLMGRVVLSKKPAEVYSGEHNEEINFADLNAGSGIYLVKVKINGSERIEKLVIEN